MSTPPKKRVSWSPEHKIVSIQKISRNYHDNLFYKKQDYDMFELDAIKDEMVDFLSSDDDSSTTSVLSRWKLPDLETTEAPALPRRHISVEYDSNSSPDDGPTLPRRRASSSGKENEQNRYISIEQFRFGYMGQLSIGKTLESTTRDAPIRQPRRLASDAKKEMGFNRFASCKQSGMERKKDSRSAPDSPTMPRRRLSDSTEIEAQSLSIEKLSLESKEANSSSRPTDAPILPRRQRSETNKRFSLAEESSVELEEYSSVTLGWERSNSHLSELANSSREGSVLETILETEDGFAPSILEPNRRVVIEIPETIFQVVLSKPEKASAFNDIAPCVARRRESISIEEERYSHELSDSASIGSLSMNNSTSEKFISYRTTKHFCSMDSTDSPVSFTGRAA